MDALIFINTLSMESEMALALLSTLAQNEVESLSANYENYKYLNVKFS